MVRTNRRQTIILRAGVVASMLLLMLAMIPVGYSQVDAKQKPLTVVPFEIVSAEITRFEKPVNLSVGKRKLEYQEAVVLTLQISKKDYEALPPSIEPFLYIGDKEYRIYSVQQAQQKNRLTLTFHIRDWQEVSDQTPMVITIMQSGPIRNPEIFKELKTPVLDKKMIVDKRKQ